ncbi:SIS domain-containing protein [bacterium]|nr:SIS domain-containing protein [bacterium]
MVKNIPEGMKRSFERTSHPYHFYESLMSTPEGLQKVLAPSSYEMIKDSAKALQNKKAVYVIGNGTSLFDGMSIPHMMNLHTTLPSTAIPAYEFRCYPPNQLDENTAVIGISHSGTSPETVKAVRFASERGATVISITDNEESEMCRIADHVIFSENDEGQGPKNRSYVASLLRGHLLALECARLEGRPVDDVIEFYKDSPAVAERVLKENEDEIKAYATERAAEELQRVVIAGSGFQYPTACEGALKTAEAALLYSNYWELEEGLHGPWYNMQPHELLIVNAISGMTYEKSRLLVNGIDEISSNSWAITDTDDSFSGANLITRLPGGLPESVYGLYAILPIYTFIYYYALAAGKNHIDHGPYDRQKFMDARWVLRQLKK